MRKRNAIICGSAFLLVLAGYVAWCWRSYYLPIPVTYQNGASDDVVALVDKLRKEDPFWRPHPMNKDGAILMLMKPWLSFRGSIHVHVTQSSDGRMECHILGGQSDMLSSDRYVKENGKWISQRDRSDGIGILAFPD